MPMQRINAIDPQAATGAAKTLVDGVQRKLGFVPNFMRTLAVSPATLDAYLSFGDRLNQGILSPKLREQIALTVAYSDSCQYCLAAHTAIGGMLGLAWLSWHRLRRRGPRERGTAVGRASFALFAGIYYWFPKATGRQMNSLLGKIHFWGSLICINTVFMPMFIQGLGGMNRRMYDGGAQYAHNQGLPLKLNLVIGIAAWSLGLFQIPFIINFFASIFWGKTVDKNPWEATTLEWSAPSPPGHGNFLTEPIVYRAPYEYSVPGAAKDFSPQFEPEKA